ncbi:sugar transferase [Streptomyces candidus]|uniref:Exopolysaccharide biosynthesis polyprenyl glycosylphosphotransferase n=1 Tax=Streptomyces candidus TaxID=67283 RepID=A0A7X0LRH8_9ACTN|nr:sugar transferase [Streptomyces candidus]MBB6438658.1 exopolysaccharide biosynthesis polyprenyl glycosylphosphotransferase [Streptomyces candidus]GHH45154.1 transferase [Streptomyces candidus]
MTTESAPAPQASPREAVLSSTLLHAPRRSPRRRPAAPAGNAARGNRHLATLLTSDAIALSAALLLSPGIARPWWPIVPLVCVQLLLLAHCGLYRPRLSPAALAELPALCGLALLQWCVTTEALAAYGSEPGGWSAVCAAAALQALLVCGGRAGAYRLNRRRAARNPQSTLVVGGGPAAERLTAALYERAEYGMRPVGRVGTPEKPSADLRTLPVLATAEDVSRAVVQADVRHAVFLRPHEGEVDPQALAALLTGLGCRLWAVEGPAADSAGPGASAGADHLWGFAVRPMAVPRKTVALKAKRTLDVVLAAVFLVLAAPVLAVCALAVRLSDGPGVLFRQERVGLHGRPFVLLKFRTLRPADAHESATRWSVALDRRMSPVGSLLRRSSLDELPQLWNVLRGDMSMVGPRPERPYFVTQFGQTYPGYRARHRVPVGITGLAQVNGLRGDTSIEDRARFDNHYIETWSLWQDMCILVRTAASLFRFGGS